LRQLDENHDRAKAARVCKLFYETVRDLIDINCPNDEGFNAVGHDIETDDYKRLLIHMSHPKFKLDMEQMSGIYMLDNIMSFLRQLAEPVPVPSGKDSTNAIDCLDQLLDNKVIHVLAKYGLPLLLVVYLKTRNIEWIRKLLTMFPCRPLLARFFTTKKSLMRATNYTILDDLLTFDKPDLIELFCGSPVTEESYAELNKAYPSYREFELKPWLTEEELDKFSRSYIEHANSSDSSSEEEETDSESAKPQRPRSESFRTISDCYVEYTTADLEAGWLADIEGDIKRRLMDRSVFTHRTEIVKALLLKQITIAQDNDYSVTRIIERHGSCKKISCMLMPTILPFLTEATEKQKYAWAMRVLLSPPNVETMDFILKWIGKDYPIDTDWAANYVLSDDRTDRTVLLLDALVKCNKFAAAEPKADDTESKQTKKKHKRSASKQKDEEKETKKSKKQKTK